MHASSLRVKVSETDASAGWMPRINDQSASRKSSAPATVETMCWVRPLRRSETGVVHIGIEQGILVRNSVIQIVDIEDLRAAGRLQWMRSWGRQNTYAADHAHRRGSYPGADPHVR